MEESGVIICHTKEGYDAMAIIAEAKDRCEDKDSSRQGKPMRTLRNAMIHVQVTSYMGKLGF